MSAHISAGKGFKGSGSGSKGISNKKPAYFANGLGRKKIVVLELIVWEDDLDSACQAGTLCHAPRVTPSRPDNSVMGKKNLNPADAYREYAGVYISSYMLTYL